MGFQCSWGEYGDKAFRGVLTPSGLPQYIRGAIKSASVEAVNIGTMELYFLSMFGLFNAEDVRRLAISYPWQSKAQIYLAKRSEEFAAC
jgi:hypothetical protein